MTVIQPELQDGVWGWEASLDPRGRAGHTAWASRGSVLLMGDIKDSLANSMEVVVGNRSELFYHLDVKVSLACGIEDVERSQMILTGGLQHDRKVGVYRGDGRYYSHLPSLNTGRQSHGCAGYYNTVLGVRSLVLLVAGGLNSFNRSLYSSEMFEFDVKQRDWRYASPLHLSLTGLRGATIHNTIFMSGGFDKNTGAASRREVLKYDGPEDR